MSKVLDEIKILFAKRAHPMPSDTSESDNMDIEINREILIEGFDAAIALELPILFADWKDKYAYQKSTPGAWFIINNPDLFFHDNSSLYKFWETNIYTP